MKNVIYEKCYICGELVEFKIAKNATLLRDATCANCGSSIRTSDLAKILVESFGENDKCLLENKEKLASLRILNLASTGKIHEALKGLPMYYFGEFFDEAIPGELFHGILCIDLQNICFSDGYFDLIVTEDVLEHVQDFDKAFQEINRVLKVGGTHLFTVPVHEKYPTTDRTTNPKIIYHGDPIRNEGARVITDFGNDVKELLVKYGMNTTVYSVHKFFKEEEISYMDQEYENYLNNRNDLSKVFRYNSVVFLAKKDRKLQMDFTGERFIPRKATGDIIIEHYQRYESILEAVHGKRVLDAACGAGYGSFILAQQAKSVIGIDISAEAIEYADTQYKQSNLEYKIASIEKLPLEDSSIDIVISFETIEHVDEELQGKFIKEIKRVLTPEGILIMSSPDKLTYSDIPQYLNPYHIKEFYYDEFKEFLTPYFKNLKIYRQAVLKKNLGVIENIEKKEDIKVIKKINIGNNVPQYYIAICSDININYNIGSILFDSKKDKIEASNLLYDIGNDFNAYDRIEIEPNRAGNVFNLKIDLSHIKHIKRMRFDPIEGIGCICKILNVNSDIGHISIHAINGDANHRNNEYNFLTDDPQFLIEGDFSKITFFEITYQLGVLTLPEIINELTAQKNELTAQKNELTAQKNELTAQKNELTAQKNELTAQKNELTAQKNELTAQNKILEMRLNLILSSNSYHAIQKYYKIRDLLLPPDSKRRTLMKRIKKAFLKKTIETNSENNCPPREIINVDGLNRKLLIIDHLIPKFDNDAGSRNMYQYLKYFKEIGLEVFFLADDAARPAKYVDSLSSLGVNVLNKCSSSDEFIEWMRREKPSYVYLIRPHIAGKYIGGIKENLTSKILYHPADFHYIREVRQYKLLKDPAILQQAKYSRNLEFSLFQLVDVIYTVSEYETNLLKKKFPQKRAATIPVFIYDEAAIAVPLRNFKQRKDITFVGGFLHQPNVDGIIWFMEKIWPLVKGKLPDVRVNIIGSNPTEPILRLKEANVTGYITDNELDNYYNESRIIIAPLRFGAGIKGKVIEALAKGLPVVTTPIGAEGIDQTNTILYSAQDENEFSERIISLYENADECEKLSEAAIAYIKKNFCMDKLRAVIEYDFK